MKKTRDELIHDAASVMTQELVDQGKLIEAGFMIFQELAIPKDASHQQIVDMRFAYMAGAEHLWSSILNVLDPGEDASERDMKRMDLISKEINEWRDEVKARGIGTGS